MVTASSARDIIIRAPQKELAEATVLQIIEKMDYSDPARAALDIAGAIRRAGGRAILASNGGPMMNELKHAGFEHLDLGPKSSNPLKVWGTYNQLSQFITREKVDIVHLRSRASAWPARIAAKRKDIATVATVSDLDSGGGFFQSRMAKSLEKADHLIAVSQHMTDALRKAGLPEKQIATVARGVDLGRFNPGALKAGRIIDLAQKWQISDNTSVVLGVGLDPNERGTRLLVEAMALVKKEGAQAILLGQDEGSLDKLQSLALKKGVEGKVRLMGPCDDMASAYMLADVVVSPSAHPPLVARPAMEAQAMGRPVVATRHGCHMEIVLDNQTGWLVIPNNDAAIAEGIDKALNLDKASRRAVALAARHQASENFSLESMVARTLSIYVRFLAEKRSK